MCCSDVITVSVTVEQWYFVYLSIFPLLIQIYLVSYATRHKKNIFFPSGFFITDINRFFTVKDHASGLTLELSQPSSYEALGKQ